MTRRSIHLKDANILIMGFTFKENCPDLRNTRVIDICHELNEYNCLTDIYDPWVDASEAMIEYGVHIKKELTENFYDAIIVAVAHEQFINMGAAGISKLAKENSVIYDIKYVLSPEDSQLRL